MSDNTLKLIMLLEARINALETRIASLESQPKREYKDPFVPEQVFHHPYLGTEKCHL